MRAYFRNDDGTLEIGRVLVENGKVYSVQGLELEPDNQAVSLAGWPDEHAVSYENGKVLVAGLVEIVVDPEYGPDEFWNRWGTLWADSPSYPEHVEAADAIATLRDPANDRVTLTRAAANALLDYARQLPEWTDGQYTALIEA